jgi:hypothetical protein
VKRVTRKWLKAVLDGSGDPHDFDIDDADDLLNLDARQRATIRELEARLKAVANAQKSHGYNCTCTECCEARAAADLTNKNWRRGT